MNDIEAKLKAPFYSSQVNWKVQSTTKDKKKGMMVSYSDARAIMDRLDQVVGFENWRDEYTTIADKGILCILYIHIGDEWIGKSDGAAFTDVESTKGGITDAFKRAASRWGIGRYHYGIPSVWIELDEFKRPTRTNAEIWALAFRGQEIPVQFLPEDDPLRKATRESKSKTVSPKPATTKVAAKKESEAKKKESDKQPELPTVPADTLKAAALDHAGHHIIPEGVGVPLAGQTLAQALTEPDLGPSIISFLAGKINNKAGKKFEPGDNADYKRLQQAALTIYEANTNKN
jgi:hypothetical protein